MRICDLPEEKIVVGMRIRSLVPPHTKLGTIVNIELDDDRYAWIHWDGDHKPISGFYGNNCEREVIELVKLS